MKFHFNHAHYSAKAISIFDICLVRIYNEALRERMLKANIVPVELQNCRLAPTILFQSNCRIAGLAPYNIGFL